MPFLRLYIAFRYALRKELGLSDNNLMEIPGSKGWLLTQKTLDWLEKYAKSIINLCNDSENGVVQSIMEKQSVLRDFKKECNNFIDFHGWYNMLFQNILKEKALFDGR